MKKVLKVGLAVGSLAFFFTFFGCSNQIEEKQDYLGYLSLLNQLLVVLQVQFQPFLQIQSPEH